MILFIFEGEKREPELFRSIEKLFMKDNQNIVCSFENSIYELYRILKDLDGDGDIVSILKEHYKERKDSPFKENVKSSDFAEIYLIFDYDFQNRNLSLEKMNKQLLEMLEVFDDETGNGKLYINYPMVEAIRYTKKLPDSDYKYYLISRKECQSCSFKEIADKYSYYKSLDFLTLSFKRDISIKEIETRKNNWKMVGIQNVSKANQICNGSFSIPDNKDTISQLRIFRKQLDKFIKESESVSILSAFPLLLFDYFPVDFLK